MPQDPGVYIFLGEDRNVLYVGKALNLKKRVSSYFTKKDLDPKTRTLVDQIKKIKTIPVNSELESLILEANLIKKYKPKYNARLTDDKSYIQIKITIADNTPKVLLSRREDDGKSAYFGPFPSSADVKLVLSLIRKIFPFQGVLNHQKRYCLYFHLGLCPCPPMFKDDAELKEYRKNIKRIIQFLEGKTKKVITGLEKERGKLSKNENFEKASDLQKKIDAISLITTRFYMPFEFERNPNLRKQVIKEGLKHLQSQLNKNGVKVNSLTRIECYDISNISGVHATGSMVVFVNGEKDSGSYRRFRIKRPPRVVPNDFAMIGEVLGRRLNHDEWELPNLIIIDGGKGQVSSAKKIIDEKKLSIPVIGIAKKEETLITSDLKPVKLNKNSPAIILVRRIRDEAHRFAINYHKKLRSKYLFAN